MSSAESSASDQALSALDPLRDPYAVLGVDRRAEEPDIRRAYFQMVRQYPPERDPNRFQQIRAAYEKVRTPERRALTDLFLLQPPPELPNRRDPQYDLSVHAEDILLLAMAAVEIPMHQEVRELS